MHRLMWLLPRNASSAVVVLLSVSGCAGSVVGQRPLSERESYIIGAVGHAWEALEGAPLPVKAAGRLASIGVVEATCVQAEELCLYPCDRLASCAVWTDGPAVVINVSHARYEPGHWHDTAILHESLHFLAGALDPYGWPDTYHEIQTFWPGQTENNVYSIVSGDLETYGAH